MKDFWLSCGHHLLDRDEGGGLVVTDEFLKVYLARPELDAAAGGLRGRDARCMPRCWPIRAAPVAADEIAAIADADARENWQVMIAFRDHLMRHRRWRRPISTSCARGAQGRRISSSISSCT